MSSAAGHGTRWAGTRTAGTRQPGYRIRAGRHDEAVIQAEVRRLARALRPYGVLHRDALEHAAGAKHWHQGGFDNALAAAVRRGLIQRLPAGFYRTP